jgi:hypothetical protein
MPAMLRFYPNSTEHICHPLVFARYHLAAYQNESLRSRAELTYSVAFAKMARRRKERALNFVKGGPSGAELKKLTRTTTARKKSSSPIEFIWGVPIPQLEWVDAAATLKREQGRYLTDSRVGRPEWRDAYRLFDRPAQDGRHTGLFRTFAEIEATEEGVLSFARTYGCLLGANGPSIYIHDEFDVEVISHGETLDFWRAQIVQMKAGVLLWDLVSSGSAEATEAIRASGLLEEVANSPVGIILGQQLRFQEQDTNSAALNLLGLYVNQHLRNKESRTDVYRQLRLFGTPPALKLVDQPSNLLSAIWLQFAIAVDSGKRFSKCDFCGSWFEVSPYRRGQRPDSHYCRPSCRVNAYRERIAKAQELYKQKKPYPEIARTLGTSIPQVKKWAHASGKSPPRGSRA